MLETYLSMDVYIQCLAAFTRICGPPFFISKIKFPSDKQSNGKV